MKQYLLALALAAMPALGNFAGGLLAETFRASQRTLSLALHVAAGIVLAVVAVELLPESFEAAPAWVIVLAFVLGGGFFMLADSVIERLGGSRSSSATDAGGAAPVPQAAGGPWVIYFGVAVDLFSDGVMIGAASTVEFGLGLLLALGQVPGDVPEGFASIATFRAQGVPRRRRLLLAASFALPIFLGVTVGYWGVRGAPEWVKFALLAVTAGTLTTVAVEEILPEAHKVKEPRLASACFVGGFALFALLSSYLG